MQGRKCVTQAMEYVQYIFVTFKNKLICCLLYTFTNSNIKASAQHKGFSLELYSFTHSSTLTHLHTNPYRVSWVSISTVTVVITVLSSSVLSFSLLVVLATTRNCSRGSLRAPIFWSRRMVKCTCRKEREKENLRDCVTLGRNVKVSKLQSTFHSSSTLSSTHTPIPFTNLDIHIGLYIKLKHLSFTT